MGAGTDFSMNAYMPSVTLGTTMRPELSVFSVAMIWPSFTTWKTASGRGSSESSSFSSSILTRASFSKTKLTSCLPSQTNSCLTLSGSGLRE